MKIQEAFDLIKKYESWGNLHTVLNIELWGCSDDYTNNHYELEIDHNPDTFIGTIDQIIERLQLLISKLENELF